MEKAQEVFEAAVKAEEAGDSARAIRLFEECSRLAPPYFLAKLRVAILLSDSGKWKEAIRVGRQVAKRRPRVPLAYCVIAWSYLHLNRPTMAERFFRKAVTIKRDPETLLVYGATLRELERIDEAEEYFNEALTLDPANDETHYNLALVHKIKGQVALAEKHFKRAIELDPKYALAYAGLGELLLGQNRTKEAVGYLKSAIRHKPSDGWSRAYLANALIRLRKLRAAEDQLGRLLELWPTHSLPYWCYGDFLAGERKDISTAEWYFRKAVEIEPKDAIPNYYLGRYLFYCGPEKEAKKFLTKAAHLGHAKARELLQQLKGTGGR